METRLLSFTTVCTQLWSMKKGFLSAGHIFSAISQVPMPWRLKLPVTETKVLLQDEVANPRLARGGRLGSLIAVAAWMVLYSCYPAPSAFWIPCFSSALFA